MKYKVEYTVEGFENVFSSEAYDTYQEAEDNRKDIGGYEGVQNTSIVEVGDASTSASK